MLDEERKKLAALSNRSAPAERSRSRRGGCHRRALRADRSCRSIRTLSARAWRPFRQPLATKAILAVGRFAAHETAIWRQTKPIERLPEHYRIRLSLDYRMIVHWQPGKVLRILDVIPRQDLESWIRRQG